MLKDSLLVLQMYKPTKLAFWCTRKMHGNVRNIGKFDYNALQNVAPKDLKAEYFAKETKKCQFLSNLMDKAVKNLYDHGCPKNQELVELEQQMWICSSYPFRHKTTLRYAE